MYIWIILYIIGVIVAPIAAFYQCKIEKLDYTLTDLAFSIMCSWLSWLLVLLIILQIIIDNGNKVIIFKNKKK